MYFPAEILKFAANPPPKKKPQHSIFPFSIVYFYMINANYILVI